MTPGQLLTAILLAVAISAVGTWQVQDWRYGKQLADQGEADQKTLAGIASAAAEASEKSRKTEQERQRVIDQVRTDAANQKQKDDATAAEQRADNDGLREQTRKLLADKSSLNSRLAQRGKTINDLVDLLSELRSEADGYAGELASALTASRRAGFACESSYDAVVMQPVDPNLTQRMLKELSASPTTATKD